MNYQKPELFLVGAAQGLVLGGDPLGDFVDNDASCSNETPSRAIPYC